MCAAWWRSTYALVVKVAGHCLYPVYSTIAKVIDWPSLICQHNELVE